MPDRSPAADPGQQLVLAPEGDVVCMGFLTYCMLLVVEALPTKNDGAPIRDVVDSLGDDAAIVASILARWKVPTTLVSSPVGDDDYGTKVLDQLKASNMDVEHRLSRGASTPLEVGIVDGTGSRTYFQQRDPRAVAALPTPSIAQLSKARMLYVDWYDGTKVPEAMERARAQGVPVFLNLESRYFGSPELTDLLRFANVCQVSMDEPRASGDPSDIARALLNEGVGTVLITLGAEGCTVAQRNQAFHIRPPEVKVVDGYGAGAAFSAGVIHGLVAGWSLERCARFATAHAGIKCGIAGNARLPVRRVQRVAANLPVRPLTL